MVWPNLFLMNVFFALKGSKLLTIISYHGSWMLCHVAAVKDSPHSSIVQIIAETMVWPMVWPNFFLINVFFALKGSKLFTTIKFFILFYS